MTSHLEKEIANKQFKNFEEILNILEVNIILEMD